LSFIVPQARDDGGSEAALQGCHPFGALDACSGQAFHVHRSRDKPHLLEPGKQAEQHFFGIHPFEEPVLP
jgi:hypothetical protein